MGASVKLRRKGCQVCAGYSCVGSAKDLKTSKLGGGRTCVDIRGGRFAGFGLKIGARPVWPNGGDGRHVVSSQNLCQGPYFKS